MMFAMEKAGPPPQKKLNDKYILGDEIGKGAYGHVYKGLDIENGDFVAIKQVSLKNISQKDLNIIMQEIDLLKNLNHKNIVKYIDSVQTETHLNIILEYIENGSLANIVKPEKFGAFPESLVVVYITQVLEGLLYLHEQGVIHRDIKGANILTTKEGFVKLADFGVATKLTEAGINTYSIVGTPYWMAPERTVKPISFKSQFNFKHRMIEMSGASAASDIWSVGCTVIELLTCEPPYFDIQPMSALFRIVQDDHPPIPGHLSPGLTDFLHQCFQKDAKLRPDAKTLLMHPWIQNSRKDLRPSLEQTDGQIRNIPQQLTVVDKTIEVGTMERHEGAIAVRQDMGNNKECKNVVTKTHFGKTSQIFNSPKHQLSSGKIAEDKISIEEGNSFKVRENGNVNNEIDHDMGSKLNSNAHEVDVDDSKVWGKGSKLDSYKAVELRSLVRMLKPGQSEDNIVSACWRLFAIFQNFPEQKLVFLNQYGLVPLTEMLEVASNWVLISVLQLINQLINENSTCLENVCLMGLIPVAMNLASPDYVKEVRMQVAYFVQNLCQASAFTLQMFIACRGLPVLVNFFEPDYSEYRDMVHIAVDCIWHVFNLQPCIPRKMLCYLSAKNGAVNRLVYTLNSLNDAVRLASTVHRGANEIPVSQVGASTLDLCLQTASGAMSGSGMLNARLGSTNFSQIVSQMVPSLNTDVPREYLEKVADLLLEFSHADTSVKVFMCGLSLLMRLFQMLKELESSILLKILKCINQLSTDPNCLENLQLADAIKYLIPNLEQGDGPLVPEIHMEVLNALNNLCKINKRRQEEAAENGIIPYLMRFTVNSSPFRLTALSLLCDMAHASHYTREQLRVHNGLDIYLSLLDDEAWSITALDSIAVCLAHDNDRQKMEQILVRKKGVQKLVKVFRCCCEQNFVHILEPFLKIVSKSVRINTILAVSGLTPLLVARLNHPCPISRLSLLKLIKAVYEHHPEPKEFIAETGLPWKLQNLIEERGRRSGEQVLAKQMATTLLKAVYMNTVL